MTTGISLVREHAERMLPPRSLWVSFPLGRPLGKPADPAFQHRVVAAALDLLDRPTGPVLADFPEDAPSIDVQSAPACPVAFVKDSGADQTWQTRLTNELHLLKPWHDFGRRRRGRSAVGVSDSAIDEIVSRLGELLDADPLTVPDLKWFKHAIEDAKTFYIEALTAQPGEYAIDAIANILWTETDLGKAMQIFYRWFHEHPRVKLFARIVAPRQVVDQPGSQASDVRSSPV
ncbi:MAG: hypothetical protein O3A63_16725 [Proteobacteria bacterium]|nr:hypothetical protein [Pseudomonadota bacterium]